MPCSGHTVWSIAAICGTVVSSSTSGENKLLPINNNQSIPPSSLGFYVQFSFEMQEPKQQHSSNCAMWGWNLLLFLTQWTCAWLHNAVHWALVVLLLPLTCLEALTKPFPLPLLLFSVHLLQNDACILAASLKSAIGYKSSLLNHFKIFSWSALNSLSCTALASNSPFCALSVLNQECLIVRVLENLCKETYFHSRSLMTLVGTGLKSVAQTGRALDICRNRSLRCCAIKLGSTY